jgi:hypothetical protein
LEIAMPTARQDIPSFDLALTMAGAISAGAYTAGVLDFLIEALDTWTRARDGAQPDPAAPQHALRLRAVSGASAGAIAGAILGASLGHDYRHRRLGDAGDGADNPLYDSWVNLVDISALLETRDLAGGAPVPSLLDSTRLVEIARKAIESGQGRPAVARAYLGEPLRFIFTLTNLRGVQYPFGMAGANYVQLMSRHGDNLRYTLSGLAGAPGCSPRADEYVLRYPAQWGQEWERFAMASLASGAFPLGLAPRELSRRSSDYACLPVLLAGGLGEADRVCELKADAGSLCAVAPDVDEEVYRFVSVDGGTIDNEPFELARVELAGGDLLARHERDGDKANCAVLMIDPFVGPLPPGPSSLDQLTLADTALATFCAVKNQARFKPQDIALAMDETIYSRFLIAPARQDRQTGDTATSIAGGAVGGFGGFLHKSYREHDFFLGRRNCQRFLAEHFTLPENNPLFAGWSAEQRARLGVKARRDDGSEWIELPIIPLMPALDPRQRPEAQEKEPVWPLDSFDPASLEAPLNQRLDGMLDSIAPTVTMGQKLLGSVFKLGWRFYARPKINAATLTSVRRQLIDHGLLSPPPLPPSSQRATAPDTGRLRDSDH